MSEDLQQILYSLERAAAENQRVCDRLMADGNYSAELPGNDASNIRRAIELLRRAPSAEQPFDQLSLDGAGGVTRRRDAEQQQQEPVAANLLSMLLKENQSPNYDELWIDLDMCARLISEFLAGYTHQQPQVQTATHNNSTINDLGSEEPAQAAAQSVEVQPQVQGAPKPLIENPPILERIEGALQRFRDQSFSMRVPVDPTDIDVVLADCKALLSQPRAAVPSHVVPDDVRAAVERMCTPLDKSWLFGTTAEVDAKCMRIIKEFIDSLVAAAAKPTRAAVPDDADRVTVPSAAINWLKEKYPALCEKSGLCERIGGRLYTKTFLAAAPVSPAAVPDAAEEIHVNIEGGDVYTLPLEPTNGAPRFVVHVPRQGAAVLDGRNSGIEAVARMVEKKAENYAEEFGTDDMGGLSFGRGSHADIKMDHHNFMLELVEEIRALAAAPAQPGDATPKQERGDE